MLQGYLARFSSLGCAIIQSVACLSPERPGFDPSTARVRLMVDKTTSEQVFLTVLRFSFVTIILPMLDTYINLPVARTRKTNGQVWEPAKKQCSCGNWGAFNRKCFRCLGLERVKVREKLIRWQHPDIKLTCILAIEPDHTQWRTEGGLGCSNPPPPPKFRRPSKIMPNSTRLWKLLKIVEFRTPTPQYVRKKGSKILKLPRFAIFLH